MRVHTQSKNEFTLLPLTNFSFIPHSHDSIRMNRKTKLLYCWRAVASIILFVRPIFLPRHLESFPSISGCGSKSSDCVVSVIRVLLVIAYLYSIQQIQNFNRIELQQRSEYFLFFYVTIIAWTNLKGIWSVKIHLLSSLVNAKSIVTWCLLGFGFQFCFQGFRSWVSRHQQTLTLNAEGKSTMISARKYLCMGPILIWLIAFSLLLLFSFFLRGNIWFRDVSIEKKCIAIKCISSLRLI